MRTDWEHLRMVSASAISPVLAYYTPTKGFLLALVLAFAFNIYADMKLDGRGTAFLNTPDILVLDGRHAV